MAATSDQGLESLLQNFEQIHQEYKDRMAENQFLKSRCSFEIQRREAFEITCQSLKSDNERLTKTYTESFAKLSSQLERVTRCQSLKEELRKAKDDHLSKEGEYKKTIEMLKQEHTEKINELTMQIRNLQEANKELQHDVTAHKTDINFLTSSLEQVNFDLESKYHQEIQDLRDLLFLDQEEKKELHKKLQNAENELLICKTKQAEQQRESTSNHHVETLKQKIMKLRKENEILKRQLQGSQFEET